MNPMLRNRLCKNNPVAMAKFFNVIVSEIFNTLFGFDKDATVGIFGPLRSYYGMVEAQNRGTLHIHLLLWMKCRLTPEDLFEKLNTDADFKSRLFQYLSTVNLSSFLFQSF